MNLPPPPIYLIGASNEVAKLSVYINLMRRVMKNISLSWRIFQSDAQCIETSDINYI